jgi:restriction endonuclease Mrr
MTSMPEQTATVESAHLPTAAEVVLGVDTHKDEHVAAVVTALGLLAATASFPATAAGYEELHAWARKFGLVRRAGGSLDHGADAVGRLPDGRTMVIQCKRYAPSSTIASRELRELLGAKVYFQADVAVFVTTTRFSRSTERFAVEHGILAVHRDHLGLWNNGASLVSLSRVNGRGQGDSLHRACWKQAYGK